MKKIMFLAVFLSAAMLLLPLGVMGGRDAVSVSATVKNEIPKANKINGETFLVQNTENGSITEIEAEDYIFGVVAAEMPALYEEEALKAQAVAAFTFACLRKAENSSKEYDITNNHTTDQSFITKEEALKKWGENASKYEEKIKAAIKAVSGYMITYEDKPIVAVYHAISSGKTEDAKDIWGEEFPYLKPVSSEGDKLSKDYITEAQFSAEEIKTKLSSDIEFSGEESGYFGKPTRTDSGVVKEISVCSQELKGARVRTLLDLRSSNFEVEFKDGKYIFTVYGYGHGVGMSQNGANYMAKQGSNFKEILTHYYKGCKVEKV